MIIMHNVYDVKAKNWLANFKFEYVVYVDRLKTTK